MVCPVWYVCRLISTSESALTYLRHDVHGEVGQHGQRQEEREVLHDQPTNTLSTSEEHQARSAIVQPPLRPSLIQESYR